MSFQFSDIIFSGINRIVICGPEFKPTENMTGSQSISGNRLRVSSVSSLNPPELVSDSGSSSIFEDFDPHEYSKRHPIYEIGSLANVQARSEHYGSDNWFFVHYITESESLQGLSLTFDVPVHILRQYNGIVCECSYGGSFHLRKILLIPVSKCGSTMATLMINKLPHHDITVKGDTNGDESTEESYLDTFGERKPRAAIGEVDLSHVFGSDIPRIVLGDLKAEFTVLEQHEDIMNDEKTLKGFTWVNKVPEFIIEAPAKDFLSFRRYHSKEKECNASSEGTAAETDSQKDKADRSYSDRCTGPSVLRRLFGSCGKNGPNQTILLVDDPLHDTFEMK